MCVDSGKYESLHNLNAFHVCLYFGVVYGVGVCGLVCVVVCCLFLTSGYCLLCCDVV